MQLTKEKFDYKLAICKFRVKIRSLAEEAKIIRKEARKVNHYYAELYKGFITPLRMGLDLHNIEIVKREQRYTLLAYAYFRGIPYSKVENNSSTFPRPKTIKRILKSLTRREFCVNDIQNWLITQ